MQVPRAASAVERTFTISKPYSSSSPIDIHTLVWSSQSSSTDRSPALLFLPYWGGSAATFHRIPPLLRVTASNEPFSTIISASHRGTGKSFPASPDEPQVYSIEALASDFVELLQQLVAENLVKPEHGIVIGAHSMSAKVALAGFASLSQASDDRLKDLIRGIFLIAPSPPSPLVLPPDLAENSLHAYDNEASVVWTVENALSDGDRGFARMKSAGDLAGLVGDSTSLSPGMKSAWPKFGMPADIRPQLRTTAARKPIRIVVGEGDKVETVDKVQQETLGFLQSEKWPVSVEVLKREQNPHCGCGHLLPLEAPEWLAQQLSDFARSLSDN